MACPPRPGALVMEIEKNSVANPILPLHRKVLLMGFINLLFLDIFNISVDVHIEYHLTNLTSNGCPGGCLLQSTWLREGGNCACLSGELMSTGIPVATRGNPARKFDLVINRPGQTSPY